MKPIQSIFDQFRHRGIRLTIVRKSVVSILAKSKKPLCVEGIGNSLARLGLRPNKVTLYREVDFLVRGGWATALDLGGGRKCYEWASEHHHHLVCKKCHRIEELEAHEMEPSFAKFEKSLASTSGFAEIGHSLEFYGVCNRCR
jgi:Fe2+ or Zn2+ uptake regulation protein